MFTDLQNVFLYALQNRRLNELSVLKEQLNITDNDRAFIKILHYFIVMELEKGNISGDMHEIIKLLIEDVGLDINYCKLKEKPILFYYLYYKEFVLLNELLEMGADVNVKVSTGNQDNEGWIFEPLICDFIGRMDPKRDFPEDFEEQIKWLKLNGADETIEPDILPYR